jgi:hypothetical protein
MNTSKRRLMAIPMALLLGTAAGCQALEVGADGHGMILEYRNLINGRSISVKSASLADGSPFSNPGSLSGGINGRFPTWQRVPTATMAASGDHRGLPEWVEFSWQEPPYPGLEPENFPNREAYRAAVFKLFSDLAVKTFRLEIKRRVPQSVVDEVVASKRIAQPGKVADKTLWIFIFWTPDGMKMRWAMRDRATGGPFGEIVREGGDDLDRYNLK